MSAPESASFAGAAPGVVLNSAIVAGAPGIEAAVALGTTTGSEGDVEWRLNSTMMFASSNLSSASDEASRMRTSSRSLAIPGSSTELSLVISLPADAGRARDDFVEAILLKAARSADRCALEIFTRPSVDFHRISCVDEQGHV